jgi:hypothetical protein
MRKEVLASNWTPATNRLLMQVLVTLVVLIACLFVILSKGYDPNSQHWAYGTVGTLVGFWLRGGR